MPPRRLKACRQRGCPETTREKHGYCKSHAHLQSWGKHQRERGKSHYSTAEWKRTRKAVLIRDDYLCQECKRAGIIRAAYAVDHIKPRSQGGNDDESNLEALCKPCHQRKTNQEAHQTRV